jgi:hypothetical protein
MRGRLNPVTVLSLCTLGLIAVSASAGEQVRLEGIAIYGNRELPKALVIVPWKDPEPGAMAGLSSDNALDELLSPVDREVFARQLRYYRATHRAAGSD